MNRLTQFLLSLCLVAPSFAQVSVDEAYERLRQRAATAPATRPTEDDAALVERVLPQVRALLASGAAKVTAGQMREAAADFQAGAKLYGSRVRPVCADHALCLHWTAYCYMMLKDWPAARAPMDAAMLWKPADRSLTLNAALLDLHTPQAAMHGAAAVDWMLAGVVASDELAVNIMGACIDTGIKASGGKANPVRLIAACERYNAALLPPKPGQKHWGSRWLTLSEWARTQERIDKAQSRISSTQADLDAALAEHAAAKRQYDSDRRNAGMAGRAISAAPSRSEIDRTQRRVDAIAARMAQLRQAVPLPEWSTGFVPLPPESPAVTEHR